MHLRPPLAALAAGTALACLVTIPPAEAAPVAFAKGHILVQPRAGLAPTALEKIVAAHGGHVVRQLGNLGIYVVSLPATASEQATAQLLNHHPLLKFAEPDGIVAPTLAVNDPSVSSEWHLQTINAPAAWDTSIGTGIVVAVLDSGVDSTHPDLATQLVPGWNFYDNNNNTSDVYGHGTLVAGTVAAQGNNAIGVAGVAWNARIMPVRVTDTSGYGSWSAIASGLDWAADHGAGVANLSFAVQASSTTQTAAQYFQSKGGVVVNSAGNYGTLDSTPASNSLVSVSATDATDTVTSWSSYGPYVDVSAPGVSILTTASGGGYAAVSGTSFSSPITAGVIALMKATNPGLSPTQLVSILESTSVDLGTSGYDQHYGYGRVDAAAAVLAAAAATAPTDKTPPTVAIASPSGGTVAGVTAVDVNASDNVGVTRVDLLVNGIAVASDLTSPYQFAWDSSTLANGTATLVARAYDAAGNTANSSGVQVTVANGTASDTSPPTVTIESPVSGSTLSSGNKSQQITVVVNASDNVGVTSIQLSIDGTIVATSNASPLSYKWSFKRAASGVHTLSATARDAAGNTTTATSQVVK